MVLGIVDDNNKYNTCFHATHVRHGGSPRAQTRLAWKPLKKNGRERINEEKKMVLPVYFV